MGDFQDPVTSPNDPIFMLHHANLDRNKMSWMSNNEDSSDYFYGFSTVGNVISKSTGKLIRVSEEGGGLYEGIALNDFVSSNWGFTDDDLGISAHASSSELWTHADAGRCGKP